MQRKIFISKPAIKDLRSIIAYIRLDKPKAAELFKIKIETKISSLDKNAERGRKVPELKGSFYDHYRELVIPPCRIIYRVTPDSVKILRILHERKFFKLFS